MERILKDGLSFRARLIPALMVLGLGACSQAPEGSTVMAQQPLGAEGNALLTSADVRIITTTTPITQVQPGRVVPTQITCIEPSPDIAKAVHENFSLGASVGLGGLPSGVSADLAFAFAKARAEAVAQMTERLATIQLLRDGLYRACEAYANGAISDTTYAVLLSRYDDTMVTLLMGELAAGNFGRKQAALGGSTGGSSSAQLEKKAAADEQAADQASKSAEESDETVDQRNQDLGAAKARRDAAPAGSQEREVADADVRTAEANLKAAKAEQAARKENADKLLRSAASSSASAFAQAGGGSVAGSNTSAQDRAALAGHLATMQRKYLENINSDALVVACISALDRRTATASPLAAHCEKLLPQIMAGYHEVLAILKSRSLLEQDLHSIDTAVDAVKHYSEQLEALETVLDADEKPSAPGDNPGGG